MWAVHTGYLASSRDTLAQALLPPPWRGEAVQGLVATQGQGLPFPRACPCSLPAPPPEAPAWSVDTLDSHTAHRLASCPEPQI